MWVSLSTFTRIPVPIYNIIFDLQNASKQMENCRFGLWFFFFDTLFWRKFAFFLLCSWRIYCQCQMHSCLSHSPPTFFAGMITILNQSSDSHLAHMLQMFQVSWGSNALNIRLSHFQWNITYFYVLQTSGFPNTSQTVQTQTDKIRAPLELNSNQRNLKYLTGVQILELAVPVHTTKSLQFTLLKIVIFHIFAFQIVLWKSIKYILRN